MSLPPEPPADAAPPAFRYSAFISYNHRDVAAASWLHRQLETYSIPKQLRGRTTALGVLGARMSPVFQDREELAASADLAESVRAALEQSASLIVICSPNAVRSHWVNEEIRTFTALGRRNRVQCLIVGGMPHAATLPGGDPEQECLPAALFDGGAGEPLAADIRPGHESRANARLRLIAGMLGVGFDELKQREAARRHRRMAIAVAVSSAGFVITAGLAVFALIARAEAVTQRDLARQKTATAERTVEFVKSLFTVSDPSEAQGQTITARAILDAGARRIDTELRDQPTVKAELETTLGEVYAGLGLYRQGDPLVERALRLPGVEPGTRARQYAVRGEAQTRQGNYRAAVADFDRGLKLVTQPGVDRPALAARLLTSRGETRSALDDFVGADRDLAAALAMEEARVGRDHADVARVLEAQAMNAMFGDRLDAGRSLMDRALAIRLARQGELHPKVSEDLNMLGVIAYQQGDAPAAERYYARTLKVVRIVLGPDHPDVAMVENSLARVLVERRDFAGAAALLRHAVATTLKERPETHDDMAFMFANLGLAEQGLGRPAEPLFRKALVAAELHKHRNRAPVMTEIAAIECETARIPEGSARLNAAAPLMRADYPFERWRMAWLETVRAACRLAAGDRAGARALLAANAPVMRARWPEGSLFRVRFERLEKRAR